MKFIQGDCLEVLPTIKEKIDLIITDPPYNIGWKYHDKFIDKKKDYHPWCFEWFNECYKLLSDNGIICIINYPENNNILYTDVMRNIENINFIQQLIWEYPTNIGQSKKKYTRSHRTILIFSKSENYYFNPIKGKYKNPNDKRIKKLISEGKSPNHYDVFNINMCKNVSKTKIKNGMNQLPEKLVEILITSYSTKGQMILDPFVGTGTVCKVADKLGRNSIGIDIEQYSNDSKDEVEDWF